MDNNTPTRRRPFSGSHSHNNGDRRIVRYLVVVVGAGIVSTFFLQAFRFNSMILESNEDYRFQGEHGMLQFGSKRQLGSSSSAEALASIAQQVKEQIEIDRENSLIKPEENPKKKFLFLDDEEDFEDEFEIPLKEQSNEEQEGSAGNLQTPEEDFSEAPPPPDLTQDEYFGACLLIKDDNHWLIEWLAYHYHVMPLRRLIVAIDPSSQTTPKNILARWNFLMKISVWTDQEILQGSPVPEKMQIAYKNNTELMYHRHRQNTFYIKCLRTLKKEKVPWVHLTDTDEFIAINYASGMLYNLTKHHPIQDYGNVLSFLKHHQEATGTNPQCIFMPRYMFGNQEPQKRLVERNVPNKSKLKGVDFLTQRFMYRHHQKMQNGKNLVHLAAMDTIQPMANVHRISATCPSTDSVSRLNHIKRTLLKVHHYLGTKEQYFFRSDPRQVENKDDQIKKGLGVFYLRDTQRYDELNKDAKYSDSGARGWIRGFVETMGLPMAEFLLQGIGKVGVE